MPIQLENLGQFDKPPIGSKFNSTHQHAAASSFVFVCISVVGVAVYYIKCVTSCALIGSKIIELRQHGCLNIVDTDVHSIRQYQLYFVQVQGLQSCPVELSSKT